MIPGTSADLKSADRWMLVTRDRITFSGTECDKVREHLVHPDLS
jgi:hypothetical protein